MTERLDDPVRIAQFWQAVEVFSPQPLPMISQRAGGGNGTSDYSRGRPLPWEERHRRTAGEPGRVLRYDVYGGLYRLGKVREVLFARYGLDEDQDRPSDVMSAMFACTVDADGFLVPGSMVVSACAWGAGRVSSGASPVGDMAADTERYADDLEQEARARAGLRVLGAAVRGAVPDGIAAAVGAAVAVAFTALGPIGAGLTAVTANAAKSLADAAVGRSADQPGTDSDDANGRTRPRLDLAAITGDDLHAFVSWLAGRLGVADCLQPHDVRVRSREVKVDGDDGNASPFLNSFLAADLKLVADALRTHDTGCALDRYLGRPDSVGSHRRTDVRRAPEHVLESCRPGLIPPGRWVTAVDRPLALSQQFAVNRVVHEHGDGQPGVFAVNGPPGTGKTTMLRDVMAAIIVRRATRLASLPSPEHAFIGEPRIWKRPAFTHRISSLQPELTGDEIVVASSNNAAVKNVTEEIPGPKGVADQWRSAAAAVDYFSATAAQVSGEGSWALLTAILGNAANRSAFVTKFWFGADGEGAHTGAGLLDILRSDSPAPDWRSAVSDFRRALEAVQSLAAERDQVHDHLMRVGRNRDERAAAAAARRDASAARAQAQARRPAAATGHDAAVRRQAEAGAAATAYQRTRPGLFTARAVRRRWNEGRDELAQQLRGAAAEVTIAREALITVDADIAAASEAERIAGDAFAHAVALVTSAERAIAEARWRWGARVPAGPEYHETVRPDLIERRELSAPWADEEFSCARTRLFLAALALHKAFILNARRPLRRNLNALTDILNGKGRPSDPAATLAAWQSLFLVVPVVSTTFASVGSMFAGLGREALGWLLVDEAGQAAPQQAAGALWRCRRALVVGDPLQLEPVVTLPWGGQRALLDAFGVSPLWAPSRSSVQHLADRLATSGTSLPGPGDDDVWVGAPLRVHRRCDRPMFTVSNAIAYHGLMVFGTPAYDEPFYGENAWIDVRSGVTGSNWIPAEGGQLEEVLTRLRDVGGIEASELRVISPYRRVADHCQETFHRVFDGVSENDLKKLVGTVHVMQGREANVVILVLGGDPGRPGSRRFALETPNLLNVAVTRARRRLYVIGNHSTWGGERYFSALTAPGLLKRYCPPPPGWTPASR